MEIPIRIHHNHRMVLYQQHDQQQINANFILIVQVSREIFIVVVNKKTKNLLFLLGARNRVTLDIQGPAGLS